MDVVLNGWTFSSIVDSADAHFSVAYRTNSDSALHQSTMNPKPQEVFSGGSQELQPKRGKGRIQWQRHREAFIYSCAMYESKLQTWEDTKEFVSEADRDS